MARRFFFLLLLLSLWTAWLHPLLAQVSPASSETATKSAASPTDTSAANPNPEARGSTQTNSASADYVLSSTDTIEMGVFREPDLTTRTSIAADGTIQLPLIGDIKVAGLTLRNARQLIQKLYNADYLVEPQIRLDVVSFGLQQFTILGEVTKPGAYEFPGGKPLNLLQAIAMAGGFTQYAGSVTIKRAGRGGAGEAIKINAKKLATDRKAQFVVTPGDVITVAESWF